jgi:hypothetical protein
MLNELASIVFPSRAKAGVLTNQDRSDLKHIAIAAHHKIAAFVTAEDALVQASPRIEATFGTKVVHVKDLADTLRSATNISSPLEIGFSDRELRLSEVTEGHSSAIRKLVDSFKLPRNLHSLVLAQGVQASTRRSLAITFGDKIVCAAFWQPQSVLQGVLEAFLLIDEDEASVLVAVNALLNQLSRIASGRGPARLRLIIPSSATGTQDVAVRYSFMRCMSNEAEISRYQRLTIGRVIDGESWPSIRRHIESASDMRFAEEFASIADDELRIQFRSESGAEFVIDLFDLETILSPTLFLVLDAPLFSHPLEPSTLMTCSIRLTRARCFRDPKLASFMRGRILAILEMSDFWLEVLRLFSMSRQNERQECRCCGGTYHEHNYRSQVENCCNSA